MKRLDKFSSKKLNNHDLQAVQGGDVAGYHCYWNIGFCALRGKRVLMKCDSSGCSHVRCC